VLRQLDLDLSAGQGLALLGPNGSGKSTLLRLLAGLHRPERGSIRLNDRPFDPRDPDQRRRIGFVSHQSLSYDGLSARENLKLIARLHRLPDPDLAVSSALAEVGLAWVGERPVRTYSRGMSQRLSLARALLHRPELLLLDEPMSGLDPAGCRALEESLGRLRASGAAILMASHDLSHLGRIVTSVGLLRRGKIEIAESLDPHDVGAVESLYRTAFAAGEPA
jgi:heme exporter protein A